MKLFWAMLWGFLMGVYIGSYMEYRFVSKTLLSKAMET